MKPHHTSWAEVSIVYGTHARGKDAGLLTSAMTVSPSSVTGAANASDAAAPAGAASFSIASPPFASPVAGTPSPLEMSSVAISASAPLAPSSAFDLAEAFALALAAASASFLALRSSAFFALACSGAHKGSTIHQTPLASPLKCLDSPGSRCAQSRKLRTQYFPGIQQDRHDTTNVCRGGEADAASYQSPKRPKSTGCFV